MPLSFVQTDRFCQTATLEEIEKTRALFRDETNKLMDARAAQNEDKTKLEASESELQSRWQEKEEDFRKLQQNHAQERERRAKTLEQVGHYHQHLMISASLNDACLVACCELLRCRRN